MVNSTLARKYATTEWDELPSDDSVMYSSVDNDWSDSDEGSDEGLGAGSPCRDEGKMDDRPLEERVRSVASPLRPTMSDRRRPASEVASREAVREDKTPKEAGENSVQGGDQSIETKKRKKGKHAPAEVSSKKRDFLAREANSSLGSSGIASHAILTQRYKPRDPRIVTLEPTAITSSSDHEQQQQKMNLTKFEKDYHFLQEMQDEEIQTLKKRMEIWKKSGRYGRLARKKLSTSREEDEEHLAKLLQQRSHRQRLQVDRAAKRSVQQDKMSTASTLQHHENKRTTTTTMGGNDNGGGYYLKRQEHKQLVLEAKYKELHKRGGDSAVEHVMAKRRKKNCAKDRKRGGGVFPPRRLS